MYVIEFDVIVVVLYWYSMPPPMLTPWKSKPMSTLVVVLCETSVEPLKVYSMSSVALPQL